MCHDYNKIGDINKICTAYDEVRIAEDGHSQYGIPHRIWRGKLYDILQFASPR